MLVQYTDLIGLPVITDRGLQLGVVSNVIVDLQTHDAYELLVSETNPDIVDEGRDVAIPWRWINTVSNVILLRYFPGRIKMKPGSEFDAMGPGAAPARRKLRKVKPTHGEGGIERRPWS